MTSRIRTYSEMLTFPTFEERFEYLMLGGQTGVTTFGFDRYMNQSFYRSREWQDIRRFVLSRDEGCDLAIFDRPIPANALIHHVNPMAPEDLIDGKDWILDPEFLVTTMTTTHNAIHYGDKGSLPRLPVERRPNDTKLW